MSRPDPIAPVTVNTPSSPVSDTVSTHPAFAMASVHRSQYGPPGAKLNDSDILHHETITLAIHEARRTRGNKHDHHFADKLVVEVEMSMAQWAGLVSSMNTVGVPVTMKYVRDGKLQAVPGILEEPRLANTMAEAKVAASEAFDKIKDYAQVVDDLVASKASVREIREALTSLKFAIQNATPNVNYATQTLSRHAEEVVQKARADVEAMVVQHATQLGLNPADIQRKELMQ